jgi:RHS repeat-associated protein
VLVAGLFVALPPRAAAAAPESWRPAVQHEKSVPGHNFRSHSKPADPQAAAVLRESPRVTWPTPGTAEVTLPDGDAVSTGGQAQAGSLPISVSAARHVTSLPTPDRVRVELLDRPAAERVGASGLLLTVRRADVTAAEAGADAARVAVTVDYAAFRNGYGGDWATRLRLVELPMCALATPAADACRTGEQLSVDNDVRAGRITADVLLSGQATLIALTAAPSGSAGDYKASSMAASSSWQAGGAGGEFAWSYPMDAPDGLNGPEPDFDLAYSSSSIDGRVASTNNQSSWVGDGWDTSAGHVERRYKSCVDDVTFTPKPQDLCWETDNAFLSLGGKSVELVKDDTTGDWHPRDDDGARVERLTGATNGDDNGEYWKVTAVDGTQYFFGLNRLPGWASGNEVTNSAWTAPVFGNDSGEPCHASTFAASYCSQAWRWNLDYVVDPSGNAMSYFYTTETNYYGRNLTASADTAYVRGGSLERIDYGQRSSSIYSVPAPMRMSFVTEERCAAGATCGTETITSTTAKNWPDVPYDQNCTAGATCTNLYAPTFWTRRRLASVSTQLWVSGTTWRDVETWTLGYQFRDPGDGTSPILWLASVTDTGKVGGSLSLPPVTFEGLQMENRVDALEGIPAMYKWRLTDVYDEMGGHVHVNYSAKECTRAALPAPDTNTKKCFPQYWQADSGSSLTLDWFHKYVPVQVLENDVAGVAGIEETDYEYLDGGAWHYDDNELTPIKYRTWGQWRGFGRVRVTHGAPSETRSQQETLYLRGMDGDKLSSGTRSVTVTDSQGTTIIDHPALAGFQRETIVYSAAGGSVLSGSIADPWISAATATHGTTNAYMLDIADERDRTALPSGWRNTEKQTSFDSYGLPKTVNDLGDLGTGNDDQCTRLTYARNTSAWMVNYISRVESFSKPCTVTPTYPDDAISDERTFFDYSTTFGTPPTEGNETLQQRLASYSSGSPVYAQEARHTYDAYGRVSEAYDALDRKTTTAYTPATGGPVTGTAVTNPAGHVTTTTLEPAWGESTLIVDPNGRKTQLGWDPLGRVTRVWLPNRSSTQTPNLKFTYLVRTDAPSVTITETIRDDESYGPKYAFYDGQSLLRQTQEPAPDGGRVVTDKYYNSRGLESKSSRPYWNSDPAGTTLLTNVTDDTVPGQDLTVYDGAERETANIHQSFGLEKWRTTTTHYGDRVDVQPPLGGTATTRIFDADDRVVELRQYTSGTPAGDYDATKYIYTAGGQLDTVTDAAGNVWKHTYDLRGREIQTSDPDKGMETVTYDDADQMLTSTDARGVTLAYKYDNLGRKTGVYEGSTSGPQRSKWTYDTLSTGAVVNGQLAAATRYDKGNAYTTSIDGYDLMYHPTVTTTTIPAAEGALAGTYKVNTGYYANTGLPSITSYPAAGGLVAETLRYGYDTYGRLKTAQTGLGTMLTAQSYTPYGETSQLTLSAVTNKQLSETFFYEDGTRRLSETLVDRSVVPTHLADLHYKYDAAGNITKIADIPAGGASDVQCFTYDHLRRISQAWTATDDCVAAPSSAVIGGAAPYWQSWTYDKTGNRKTEINYDPATGSSTTSTYAYPAAGAVRPHALSSMTTGSRVDDYGYDPAGNTASRTVNGVQQILTWDAEGHVDTVTQGGKTSSFLYDADGDRLIRRDPDATTLYLGNTELRLPVGGTVAATRYYDLGAATATRTASGLSFEITDSHDTATLAVAAADLTVTRRRFLPFGAPRGTAPASWPDEKGYVGGAYDATTGLTHLGAREYDATTGRFLCVDSLIDVDDPQQMNGYAYANNTPITADDADGMMYRADDGGAYRGSSKYARSHPRKKPTHHHRAHRPTRHPFSLGNLLKKVMHVIRAAVHLFRRVARAISYVNASIKKEKKKSRSGYLDDATAKLLTRIATVAGAGAGICTLATEGAGTGVCGAAFAGTIVFVGIGLGAVVTANHCWKHAWIDCTLGVLTLGVGGSVWIKSSGGKAAARAAWGEAKAVGRGAKATGSAVVNGAKATGSAVVNGAKATGSAVASGAKSMWHGIGF